MIFVNLKPALIFAFSSSTTLKFYGQLYILGVCHGNSLCRISGIDNDGFLRFVVRHQIGVVVARTHP